MSLGGGGVRYVTSRYDVRVSNICSGYRGGLLGVERRERILAMEDIKEVEDIF